MIPKLWPVTFCQSCEETITERRLCSTGCHWDGSTSPVRPVRVVTYWQREMRESPKTDDGCRCRETCWTDDPCPIHGMRGPRT